MKKLISSLILILTISLLFNCSSEHSYKYNKDLTYQEKVESVMRIIKEREEMDYKKSVREGKFTEGEDIVYIAKDKNEIKLLNKFGHVYRMDDKLLRETAELIVYEKETLTALDIFIYIIIFGGILILAFMVAIGFIHAF